MFLDQQIADARDKMCWEKTIVTLVIIAAIIGLVDSRSRIDQQKHELEDRIYECNRRIEWAKLSAWDTYRDMGDALDSLETCD
jgi:hypothetical protein